MGFPQIHHKAKQVVCKLARLFNGMLHHIVSFARIDYIMRLEMEPLTLTDVNTTLSYK